ncbi:MULTISPECIES: hypothetical protein [Cupriavidus]|nr:MULTISPECIES: hypothetical protein [Cupriavidus]QYY33091.1 hypothetical protein K2O51_20420 [Cupriavidus pinatubonensis]
MVLLLGEKKAAEIAAHGCLVAAARRHGIVCLGRAATGVWPDSKGSGDA